MSRAGRALPRFYPIVDSALWVERLIPCGARLIQIRIKDGTDEHVRTEIRAAVEICRRHGATLVVNDHWRIAIDEGCDFVHLGQRDLDHADIRAIRNAKIRLGVSTRDRAELDRALAVEPAYVALGPIFPAEPVATPWAPRGLERIGEWKRRVGGVALVAMGGLTPERARAALAAGADSAAVVTDIVRHPRPEARAPRAGRAGRAPRAPAAGAARGAWPRAARGVAAPPPRPGGGPRDGPAAAGPGARSSMRPPRGGGRPP